MTSLALSTVAEENLDSTKKYLEVAGVAEIDKQFSDLVSQYENQFKLQSIEIQKQANLQMQDAMMQAGESVLGQLGTGAQADFAQDIGNAANEQAQTQQTTLSEQYAKGMEQITDQYAQYRESILGELTDQGFANLVEYEQTVDMFSMALLEQIADNLGLTYTSSIELQDELQAAGMIEQIGDTTMFTVTTLGQQQIANILTSLNDEYGGPYSERISGLVANMAESAMAQMYPGLDTESSTYQTKYADLTQRYDEWLQQNATSMYYTDLGLAEFDAGQLIVSKPTTDFPENSNISLSSESRDVYTVDSSFFGKFWDSDKEGSKQYEYVEQLIEDMRSGDMPNGSYFIANYGQALGDRTIFYFENGRVYKTQYTDNDPPPELIPGQVYIGQSADFAATLYADRKFAADLQSSFDDFNNGRHTTGDIFEWWYGKYRVNADGTATLISTRNYFGFERPIDKE